MVVRESFRFSWLTGPTVMNGATDSQFPGLPAAAVDGVNCGKRMDEVEFY